MKEDSNIPWVLGGDFYELTCEAEKSGGVPRQESAMQEIRDVIDECGLSDPGFIGPKFTWSNNQFNGEIIWERLDRFLINVSLQLHCSMFKVCHMPRLASDHRPAIAEWDYDSVTSSRVDQYRPRRFEEAWCKYADCREI